VNGFLRKTEKKRITVINAGSDQTMNKSAGGASGERGAKAIDIA